jgi:hypothetical protein
MPTSVRRRAAVKRNQNAQIGAVSGRKQQDLQQTPGWQVAVMVFVALLCIAAAFFAILKFGSSDPSNSASRDGDAVTDAARAGFSSDYGIAPWMKRQGDVQRIRWSDVVALGDGHGDVSDVSSILAALRQPMIITGSPADAWPAMTKWRSENYLARKLGMLHKVKRGRDPLFIYTNSDGSLLAPDKRRSLQIPDHVGVVSPETVERVNVSIAEFFMCDDPQCSSGGNAAAAATLDRPLYYSRVLNTAEDFGKLVTDVSETAFDFVVWDDWRDCFPNCNDQNNAAGKSAEYHAWVGHPGVITG